MKLLWLTDIHLNFLRSSERTTFYKALSMYKADKILISGDIGESDDYRTYLLELAEAVRKPVYFVHGNHDFWDASFKGVQARSRNLTRDYKNNCFWLNDLAPLMLVPGVFLIGVDGFYDLRNGNYDRAGALMRDFYCIRELFRAYRYGHTPLQLAVQKFADKETKLLMRKLRQAKEQGATKVIAVTHVPPAAESCFYRGELTDDLHLPFYSNRLMFDELTSFALENPAIDLTVLSGHTHGQGEFRFSHNLLFKVSLAEYQAPGVAEVIEV